MNEPIQRFAIVKREGIMLLLGLLAQWPIWWASIIAAAGCRHHWAEVVGDPDPPLPMITQLSITLLPLVAPIVIIALIAVFVWGCLVKSPALLLRAMCLIMMAEACLLGLSALGMIAPGLSITHRMSS